jgi:hypothetical protein
VGKGEGDGEDEDEEEEEDEEVEEEEDEEEAEEEEEEKEEEDEVGEDEVAGRCGADCWAEGDGEELGGEGNIVAGKEAAMFS